MTSIEQHPGRPDAAPPGASGARPDPDRFAFGENWSRFLSVLDDERIAEAERSLKGMLGAEEIRGKSFLDVGSGSGLFSLAAKRLGAARVHSFDFDPQSVACTEELRRRYFRDDESWTVAQASALDAEHVRSLGEWDVVYSWGVLHHTGDMWSALANVAPAVAPGGRLFISIYNDQEIRSRIWRLIKRTYNTLPPPLRKPFAALVMFPIEALKFTTELLAFQPHEYVRTWTRYKQSRGMSRWHDIVDWVGGYPYEVAKPEEIFDFFRGRGFTLDKLVTRQGIGCNEFVFRRG
jgi:2-polyprenyl-6-hydroxyphenyl methylase/3-demethylubiquinone-9 3-methyltransferase